LQIQLPSSTQTVFNSNAEIVIGATDSYLINFPGNFISNRIYRLILQNNTLFNEQSQPVRLISSNFYTMMDGSCSGHGEKDKGRCFCCTGYAGASCELCDSGFVSSSTDGNITCKEQISENCLVDTCGCVWSSSDACFATCEPIGVCNDNGNSATCTCPPQYSGGHCEKCADGYENYEAGCVKILVCNDSTCVHGSCNQESGMCVCDDNYAGTYCDECQPGWRGDGCNEMIEGHSSDIKMDKTFHTLNILAIVIAIIVLLGSIGFLIYRKYRPAGNNPYSTLNAAELNDFSLKTDFEEDDA